MLFPSCYEQVDPIPPQIIKFGCDIIFDHRSCDPIRDKIIDQSISKLISKLVVSNRVQKISGGINFDIFHAFGAPFENCQSDNLEKIFSIVKIVSS